MRRALLAFALLAFAAPAANAARVPGQVVVRFQPGARADERAAARAAVGAHRLRTLLVPGAELLRVADVDQAIARLERRGSVRYAEPNLVREPAAFPNDTSFKDLWALDNQGQPVNGVTGTAGADLNAANAWDLVTGSSAVTVAVIDSGASFGHFDLDARFWTNPGETGGTRATNGVDDDGNGLVDDWRGWDFLGDDNLPFDAYSHGTHVSGIIGAEGNNGLGVTGVAWDVRLMELRVCGPTGTACSSAATADAIAYAAAKRASIANMSLGGLGYSQLEDDAIHAAPDVLFVVAAGNGGADFAGDDNDGATPQYPCALPAPNVLCVAATDQRDALAPYSNFGAASVDVAAPGTNILSTVIPKDVVFNDAFEGANRWNWVTTDTAGRFELTTARRVSPTHGVTAPGVNPVASTSYQLTQATPVSVAGKQGCVLDWFMRMDPGPGDSLYVEIEKANPPGFVIEKILQISTVGFAEFAMELDYLASSNVRVRFTYNRGSSGQGEGVAIDDVQIYCQTTGQAYGFKSGTSMATPEVSGVAALVKARFPSITRTALKDAVVRSVDLIPALYPKTVAGGRVDARSAVAIPGDTTPPATFDLVAPANNAKLSDSTPDLDWSASSDTGSGLQQYRVLLDRGSGFNVERDKVLPGTTIITPATALPDGTYSWYVRALDKAANARNSTTQRSFTVDTVAPAAPVLSGPAQDVVTQDASPVFSWSASSDGSGTGVASYELVVDGTVRATVGSGTLATVPATPLGEGQHVWAVRARDGAGNQATSGVRVMRVDQTAPTAPGAVAPEDGARLDTASPTFNWTAATDAGGIASYRLIIDGFQSGADLPANATSAQPAAPLSDGEHTWSVIAHDRVDLVGYTPARSFIVDTTAPEPAALLAPADGATVAQTSPDLSWAPSASDDVDHQELVIDGAVARADLDPAVAAAAPQQALTLGAHTWTVRSIDAVGHTTDAAPRAFTIAGNPLTPPAPGQPLPPPPGGGSGRADFTLHVAGAARQRLRTVLALGLALTLSSDRAARVSLRAQLDRRAARRVGIARSATVARGSASLTAGATSSARLRLTAKARRALRAAARTTRGRRALARLRLRVRAHAVDTAGATALATHRFGLKP